VDGIQKQEKSKKLRSNKINRGVKRRLRTQIRNKKKEEKVKISSNKTNMKNKMNKTVS
jgi:hypothetical protein